MARKLSDHQVAALLELHAAVEESAAMLRGVLPGSHGQMPKVAPPLDGALRRIIGALETCGAAAI